MVVSVSACAAISCKGHGVQQSAILLARYVRLSSNLGVCQCLGVLQSAVTMHVDGLAALLSFLLPDSAFMGHNVTCTMSLFDLIKYGRHACPQMTCVHHTPLFLLRLHWALSASINEQSPGTADSLRVEAPLHCVRQAMHAGRVAPPIGLFGLRGVRQRNVWQAALQRELLGNVLGIISDVEVLEIPIRIWVRQAVMPSGAGQLSRVW